MSPRPSSTTRRRPGWGTICSFTMTEVSRTPGICRPCTVCRRRCRANPPRGGTLVTAGAARRRAEDIAARRGMYIIVITDGEFGDKVQAQQFVMQELLPQVTPENPYAFRLHFVGAGEGVDRVFLRQIEAAASGQGVSVVSQHHHAHLSHSHASIFDTDGCLAFLGVGTGARFGDLAQIAGGTNATTTSPITHTTDPATRRVWSRRGGRPGLPAAPCPARLRVSRRRTRTRCKSPSSSRGKGRAGISSSCRSRCPNRP